MKKSSIVLLVISLALVAVLFVLLLMGLDGEPTVAPRAPL